MIEAQSETECEIFQADRVLRIKSLLAIRRMPAKLVGRGQIAIEDPKISRIQAIGDDVIAELLTNRGEADFHTGLPLVEVVVAGKTAPQITLAISAILVHFNRRRERIGPLPRRNIAQHAAKRSEQHRRENTLVMNLAFRVAAVSVLALSGCLL